MDDDGLTVVLTPAQLTAVSGGHSINESETLSNRLWGGLEAIGGVVELIGAGALLVAPDPTLLTKAGGIGLGAHGVDTLSTGLTQVWTGQTQRTLTYRGTVAVASRLGADPKTANYIGLGVDIAVPLVISLGLGAARIAAVRGGRISLAAEEEAGGHTILKHIGQTEEELRARLPKLPPSAEAASSFSSLEVAEEAVSEGIQANKAAIKAWASTAKEGRTQAFFYQASKTVGSGVVRTTGQLTPMSTVRIVLKLQTIGDKPYYILTAFPVLPK